MTLPRIYIHIIIVMLFHFGKASNDSCLKIKETQWEDIAKGKNYDETYNELEEKQKDELNFRSPSVDLGNFKYVFYVLVAGAILFLLVKILLNINTTPIINDDTGRVYTLSEVEDKILELDLDRILKDALLVKDYRLALRINFLIIIKKLALKGKINWAKEKTNGEYFSEIQDVDIAFRFKEIVITFESIWYGERSVSEDQFNRLQPSYELFKKSLT